METKDELKNEIYSQRRKVAYQMKKAEDAVETLRIRHEEYTLLKQYNRVANRSITLLKNEKDELVKKALGLQNDLESSEETVEKLLDDVQALDNKVLSKNQALGALKSTNGKLSTVNDELTKTTKSDQNHINDVEQHRNSLLTMLENYKRNQLDALAAIELGLFLFYPEIYQEKLKKQIDPTDPQPRLFLRMFDILNKTND